MFTFIYVALLFCGCVHRLADVLGLWEVSPSHSQYLVPEMRMVRGRGHNDGAPKQLLV